MASFAVTAERLIIHAHPDPDVKRLELAQVGGYRAVVPKGKYRTGDWAIYIPEQAIVPAGLLAELGLTGKLAGPTLNRVKAMWFHGELSQGLVCSPRLLSEVNLAAAHERNIDFSARLGISKWVPEVPESLSGQAVSAVELQRWIEIEDIKRYPNIFRPGEPVIATEKIHGTTLCVTWVSETSELFVSSKGLAAQRLAFDESQTNVYWRAVRIYDIGGLLRDLVGSRNITRIALYAEVYGTCVQDLHYGATEENLPGLAVFDIAVDEGNDCNWLTQGQVRDICLRNHLKYAPVLYEGGYDYEALAALAEGHTSLGNVIHLREGLVVRSVPERHSTVVKGRAIAKFVSAGYLTRSGGTEYE